ncbi:uncharacterized protein LOC113312385 [Papaver somniferum]|uniref:uncharacterized protein LOC113312385 n=1 Tax=Papaver somniferum TaxID=3469 RepID=UPI000E70184F|nr:uncharacterized protein LOC113312385 [Papaver somniferum]
MTALKNLIFNQKCIVCMIQETKMKKMNKWLVKQLWYDADFDWDYLPSVGSSGNSGGMLTIWDSSKLVNNVKWVVCNLYSPCDYNERTVFWEDLEEVRHWWGGPICFAGDWNAVRCDAERNRGEADSRNSNFLNNFIYNHELVDLPLVGGSFTWSDMHTDPLLCRLDRFLLSVDLDNMFNEAIQIALTRVISDHKPIRLVTKPNIQSKSYFKFENSWLSHKDFVKKVAEWWGMMEYQGQASFIFFKKLQNLKFFLKKWSMEEFGGIEKKKKELTEKIAGLDQKEEGGKLPEAEFEERMKCNLELRRIEVLEAIKWHSRGNPNEFRWGIQIPLIFIELLMEEGKEIPLLSWKWMEKIALIKTELNWK